QELSDDLQRVLDQKPVRARRPSVGDRLAKWIRRNRAAVAGVSIIIAVASTFLGLRIRDLARLDAQQKAEAQDRRDAHLVEAQGFFENGDLERAIAEFGAALDLDRGSVEAVIGLASVQHSQGRDAEALQTLDAHAPLIGARRSSLRLREAI